MLLWQRTGEWRQVQQLLMDAILREAVKLRAYFSPSHAHPVSLAWSAKLPCNHLSTPGGLVKVWFMLILSLRTEFHLQEFSSFVTFDSFQIKHKEQNEEIICYKDFGCRLL